jgi:uncharacterized RDD family membrane protein YckC
MRPTRRAAFFVATSLALAAPLARAAEPTHAATPAPTPAQIQAARDLFASATKDEEAQRWADALDKLHRVADVKLTASVRYHTAFCEEKLGQSATALAHYTEARDAAEREHNKDVLELLKPPFLADLRARVPTLTIEVPPDATGAEVTLDGQPHPQGSWSTAVPLDPGTHRIEAHAPDREPFARELTLHEREVTVLDVSLPPIARPVMVAPPPASPVATKPATPPPPADVEASPPPTSEPSSRRPIAAAVGMTVGAVLLAGGGVGAFVIAGNAQSSGAATCATRTTSCDDLKTPVRTWDAVALGAWIGAAALATTAIVLWASPSKAQSAGEVHVTATASQLRLEGTF